MPLTADFEEECNIVFKKKEKEKAETPAEFISTVKVRRRVKVAG